jgi:hypothetical protein
MKYFGIADAHGIESFFQGDPTDFNHSLQAMVLDLRAGANRQRHAVVYIADLTEEAAALIQADLDDGLFIEALDNLKGEALNVSLTNLPGAEKSWSLIPNPDLDPYN